MTIIEDVTKVIESDYSDRINMIKYVSSFYQAFSNNIEDCLEKIIRSGNYGINNRILV